MFFLHSRHPPIDILAAGFLVYRTLIRISSNSISLYVSLSYFGTSFSVAPQIAPFSIGDEPANWGEAVSAVCTIVKGDLPIEVTWALNDEPITKENHGDVSISSTGKRVSLMTIEAVSARHAGEYTCTASNAAGATSYSATLAVNGTTPHEVKCLATIEESSPLFCLQAYLDD